MTGRRLAAIGLVAACCAAGAAAAQERGAASQGAKRSNGMVQLDFDDAELASVIDTIARLTNRNFIYDDRVRGRVTIVSPTPIPIDQAYAVFESVLQVKGFTTVETPGGATKIIPVRDAKESSIETVRSYRAPPNRDHYVTRLIPLRYIDAESIVNTLKPLVSKDAAMAAYEPTNTVILTESASNIRRILAILESIDVETYKEELAVIKVHHADATTMAQQVSEIYGAEVSSATTPTTRRTARGRSRTQRAAAQAAADGTPRGRVRILTDERTNSLIVLAARSSLEDIRELVAKLDVPVSGGGRIHVYYLNHANAEELSQTLNSLISGRPRTSSTPGGAPPGTTGATGAQALSAQVSALTEGITITPDPATNSLVIQASQEGFRTIAQVIEKLDVQRPQVLVEALIMEVDVTDAKDLGINALFQLFDGNDGIDLASATDAVTRGALTGATGGATAAAPFIANLVDSNRDSDGDGTVIQGIIRAAASNNGTNILSAPHVLTTDNEQAEIRIGDNIPIISSRVESAAGVETGLSTSVNVERQDVGVTLRVTPQITEGETLRLEIFQEITSINDALQDDVGNAEDVGVPLSNRRIENTVVVDDGATIVIGGLISESFSDVLSKVPWLGDIPVLGWLFKTSSRNLTKTNLLVFLTPHIVREAIDLEEETIRKREEFISKASGPLGLDPERRATLAERRREAEASGEPFRYEEFENPVSAALVQHEDRYPVARMRDIEEQRRLELERLEEERIAAETGPLYFVQAAVMRDEEEAIDTLTDLVDAGYDGALVSGDLGGEIRYEVRLGPFEKLEEANRVGGIVARSHGLTPSVLVVPRDQGEDFEP